jgi:signal transduction histidine kinase/CheY-like chemotaxis protein/HPt (histidine-containing phosphotransfer) domain-containing protein
MNILHISTILATVFNEMPLIYILMAIITALVVWLIIENINSRKNLLWYGEKPGVINTKSVNNKNLLNYLDELIVKEKPQDFELAIITNTVESHYKANMLISAGEKTHGKLIIIILHDINELKNANNRLKEELVENQKRLSQVALEAKASEEQKTELEKAFKHSSKHHIQLQKALLENERQRKQLQEAVELINIQKEELKQANEEIKHHARMKEIFFANTSHEIRTPLNAILGFTNLLIKMDPTKTQYNYLRNIKASGDNLLIVLNDILDFSKIEAGKMSFEQISFLVTEQMEFLFNTMKVKADEKSISIKQNISPEIPEVLIGDPTRLNQILINLIGNSIKFTDNGGIIELIISEKKRTGNQVQVKFEVKDNGIGIAKEKISTIFNSFTQAENETTRKYGGTGLGLAIVKQLIELQDGEIFVKSEVNKGSTFTFFLTFTVGNFSSIQKQASLTKNVIDNPDDIWLLIAEDNKINQQLAVDTIKSWEDSINIDIAGNGKEAVELIEKNNYHIVFMDIQMPEMDGIEATKYIRANLPNHKKQMPIIAMTAHALKNEKDLFIEIGMDDYISKPFAPEILTQKIAYYTQKDIQDTVKKGEKIKSIADILDKKQSELKTYAPQTKQGNFKYIDISYLEKIYKGDYKRIKKILQMYIDSVQTEVDEIDEAYKSRNYKVLQAKAHALKPKMTYLGCTDLFENAKKIEQTLKQNDDPKPLTGDVKNLTSTWPKVAEEINIFINS